MSTTTVSFTLTVNGSPANATSVVLADPTLTYGVRRTDTDATVVNSGTAMDHDGTGLYSYTFTDPAGGLTYEYWVTYVYGGETYRLQKFSVGSPTASTAGDLTTLAAVKSFMNITSTSSDSALSSLITQVSRQIENDCARTFSATNWIEYQNTGTGQMRAQVRNKPIISLSSVRWGYQTAIQVQVASGNTDVWGAFQIIQDPRTSAKTVTLTQMTSTGGTMTTTFNLTTSSYQLCSQLVAGINGVSGFSATLLGNVDVPTRWLYPWTTSIKSAGNQFVQAMGYPYIDLFGYVIDPIACTIGFQPLSSMDYFFGAGGQSTYGGGSPVSFPSMYQGLCLDYRGGFETIPDDIVLLANKVVAVTYYQGRRDMTLQSESLADYSYSQIDTVLRRQEYQDLLGPYKRVAIGHDGVVFVVDRQREIAGILEAPRFVRAVENHFPRLFDFDAGRRAALGLAQRFQQRFDGLLDRLADCRRVGVRCRLQGLNGHLEDRAVGVLELIVVEIILRQALRLRVAKSFAGPCFDFR